MLMPINDPKLVEEQYAREDNLRARRSLYEETYGPDAREVLWDAIAAAAPRRALEVGGGPGEVSERMQCELGARVSYVDISPRMTELAREHGVEDARVGDVQNLPFDDSTFDTAVAAWMLYHVPDVDRALAELARVLVPGGRLVAVTNSIRHLGELRDLIGPTAIWGGEPAFSSENGDELLRGHFASVERRDVETEVVVRDRAKIVAYQQSLSVPSRAVPEDVELPFVVHTATTVFVATR